MLKKLCVLSTFVFLLIPNVLAKEIYYVNKEGVELTKEEYEFLDFMFWNGSQDLMTKNDYNKFIKSNIMKGKLNFKEITNNNIIPFGTEVNYNNKTLKIASSCNTNCFISVTATFNGIPTIKSHDVMGALLENTSLIGSPTTSVSSSIGTRSFNDIKSFNNGFGVSVDLSTTGSSIVVSQIFRVNNGGHVYASYQHANRVISLNDSKNYTLSKAGYGGVFKFSGIAASTYDRMSGVDIAV